MTIWPAGGAGWLPLANQAFEQAGAAPLPSEGLPEHLDFPRTTEGLAALATDAGLTIITARQFAWPWTVSAKSLWTGISGGVARLGARYKAQPTSVQRKIEQSFRKLAHDEASDGVLRFDCAAVYVVAGR